MTNLSNLLKPAAIFCVIGSAALAQSVSVGAGVEAGVGASGGSASAGSSVEAGVGASTNANNATTLPAPSAAGARAAVGTEIAGEVAGKGTVLMSADDRVIGVVADTRTTADGELRYVIDLENQLGLATDLVSVGAASTAQVDGAFVLAMNEADFVAAVNSKVSARGETGAATN